MTEPLKGALSCPDHLEKLMKPVCVHYRMFNIAHLSHCYRSDVKALCQWMCSAIEAIGIKQATISAVMSDPTLNGNDDNDKILDQINLLRAMNHKLLEKVEKAYGIYSDVKNMKNKKEYDEANALRELQPNKFNNEDQLNMGSSIRYESKESELDAELEADDGIAIDELKPWNHLELSDNHVKPTPVEPKPICPDFGETIQSLANFESLMKFEEEKEK